MYGLQNNRMAPVGAEAFSPRQAAAAARPWVSVHVKNAVAPVGAKAAFAPTGATAGGEVDRVPRRRGCRRLPWAKSCGSCRGQFV